MTGATELDGAPRVREGRVDMGAYESIMAYLFITNTTDGSRLPFSVLQHALAGESAGLLGMFTCTNHWSAAGMSGIRAGTVTATALWNVVVHLPHYGAYHFTIHGTNEYGDVVGDSVRYERARAKTHLIRRR